MDHIQEMKNILGEENVIVDPDILRKYTEDLSFAYPIRPGYVVKAGTTEEVQNIIKWANKKNAPVIPVSSGSPHFRGDTVPSVGGAVIIDLSGMKRILRIDRKNRLAVIEPGVTYEELMPELKKEGMTAYMPFLPRSSKSVLTSYLEREPITIPRDHWEAQDPLLCTEVVYGSGDLFRTGSAAGPGTIEEQLAVGRALIRGLGPAQIDFTKLLQAAQGTMGVITWASVKCRLAPKLSKSFLVSSDSVAPLITLAKKVLWKRLGNCNFILNNNNLANILGKDKDAISSLRESLPPWVFIFNIVGSGMMPEERVEYQEAEFTKEVNAHGLETGTGIPEMSAEDATSILLKFSSEPYWKLRHKGGCHDIFFITVPKKTPEFIDQIYELARSSGFPGSDIGVYIQPIVQGTNYHCEFNLAYDPQDSQEVAKVKSFDQKACNSLANMGAFFSRPYGSWARVAFGRDPASVKALRKVKGIFDPNGIMNPGKLCF